MVSKEFSTILVSGLLVVIALAIPNEGLSDCAKDCMPTCLQVKDSTIPQCGDACETFCKTLGNGAEPGPVLR